MHAAAAHAVRHLFATRLQLLAIAPRARGHSVAASQNATIASAALLAAFATALATTGLVAPHTSVVAATADATALAATLASATAALAFAAPVAPHTAAAGASAEAADLAATLASATVTASQTAALATVAMEQKRPKTAQRCPKTVQRAQRLFG